MKCYEANTLLTDYVAGDLLDGPTLAALEAHLQECLQCQSQLQWERDVQQAVAEQVVPPPSPDFESRILANATRRQERSGMHRGLVSGAVAAALVLGLVLGAGVGPWQLQDGHQSVQQQGIEAQPAADRAREETVRLAFNTQSRLEDVSLTLELPPHVEVSRFPGRQRLSWNVDMEPGNNVIRLPLRIAYPKEGDIVAHLGKGASRRTFVAPLPEMEKNSEDPRL